MSIGRNEMCLCGSGRKYKKCHGNQVSHAAPRAARLAALKALDVDLGDRLLRFASTHYGPEWLQDVLESNWLLDGGDLSNEKVPFVVPWLQHFWRSSDGVSLAEEWSRNRRGRVAPDERLLLDAYAAAWVSIWEVTEVQAGVGSRLTDMLTREERFVQDVNSTTTLQRLDSLLAIVITCDGVTFFGGAHAQPLPPRFAERVAREARRLCRVRTRAVQPEKLRDPATQLELLAVWGVMVEQMLNAPPPVLQNTDGDPLVLTRDEFTLLAARDEVEERMAGLSGAEGPEEDGDDTVFVITRAGNAMHGSWENTVVGRVVVSATGLIAETNSARRADALRSALETVMNRTVRFRRRSEQTGDQIMAAARATPTTPIRPVEVMPSETRAAVRQFREQHVREWIDTAIPALGGLTPREAARLSRERTELGVLLKEMEQAEDRLPEGERIDLRWLREALGE